MKSFLDCLRERVLVFDGGMGTAIQFREPDPDAFEGKEGLNEWLCLTRPDLIAEIHASFLSAGCDVVETNSFGAFPVVLNEYGVGDQAERLGREAARIARRVADQFRTPGRPRFVAGSIGPGTKLPSLGHISYGDLRNAYEPLANGLVEGDCDLLLIETCQDLLQLRAALAAVRRVLRRRKRNLPVGIQITVETTGTMLLGTETLAALAAILPLRPAYLGLNCATGPDRMRDPVRTLCRYSPVPVSVLPNAGMPQNRRGKIVYDLDPGHFADVLTGFVEEFGVGIVGGCCGTEPRHLKALVDRLGERAAPRRDPQPLAAVSSLYQAVPLDQEPRPLIIGERTNANGSRRFRTLQAAEDWDGMVGIARDQQEEGAHVLDVCLAYVGRNETADVRRLMPRLNAEIQAPLMLDSTEPEAIQAALECLGGRCIINSINLENGETKARRVLTLCREFGCAVVALCIDERGMARTPERKLEIARRLVRLAAEYGLSPGDMLLDPLTFTLASGDAEYYDSAVATLEGIRRIKEEIPGARTLLGVSNVSFGLKSRIRQVLNSVFLHRALEAGLDAAILHAGKILGAADIPEDLLDACERLIRNDRSKGDPLEILLGADPAALAHAAEAARDLPVDERLRQRIIRGNADGLEADLDAALTRHKALAIINDILLDGMREVGEMFGSGQLQLPFVLKSAETMKAAVRYLQSHMEREESTTRGRFVIATVKGDVHDIGKNLVDIILTNNGFTVQNLGIKVPVEQMIEVLRRDPPDAVGMSGLLVKSTVVMRENLEAFNEAGIELPVVLGGAALTRRYVERDLRRVYRGRVYYARNAFEGLRLVSDICRGNPPGAEPAGMADPKEAAREPAGAVDRPGAAVVETTQPMADPPRPPFWGTRVNTDIPLNEVWKLLNLPALVRGRWGYTRAGMPPEAYAELQHTEIEPAIESLKKGALRESWLRPASVYGWFPAARHGDEIRIWESPEQSEPRWRLSFPRQVKRPHRCLVDYFAPPANDGRPRDVLGVMAVTVGETATRHAQEALAANRYHDYLLIHGFSVETVEALAEWLHREMRRELGIGDEDAPDPADLIRGRYRGRRYSFGYPACPNLEGQRVLEQILRWERIGVTLSDTFQLVPEQSTSALVVHHPAADYFTV